MPNVYKMFYIYCMSSLKEIYVKIKESKYAKITLKSSVPFFISQNKQKYLSWYFFLNLEKQNPLNSYQETVLIIY